MIVDVNGRAVVAGALIDAGNQRHLAVWRFLASGNIDTTFGTGGVFVFDSGEQSTGTGIALDGLQNILISGLIDVAPGVTDLVVVRLTAAGDLDTSFGAAGAADGQRRRDGHWERRRGLRDGKDLRRGVLEQPGRDGRGDPRGPHELGHPQCAPSPEA